jgi:UDP-N-acetylmuramoyl-tripeptide--D-alanyl-D-alanine ligase
MFRYAEIARVVRGRLEQGTDGAPRRVVHDSRSVEEGDLFVALKGERTDGHGFLGEAFARGAGGALVSAGGSVPQGSRNVIVVADTRQALWDFAAAWRKTLGGTFVGVTGTCGKTTTKALVAHLVSGEKEVFAAPESYNTRIGLPLALLAMPATAEVGVFEVGAGGPGEILPLASLLAPRLAILTLVGRGHLAGFGDAAAVAREKWDLVRALPEAGTAIVNADSPELVEAAAGWKGRTLTFGVAAGRLRGRVVQVFPALVVETADPPLRLLSPLLGRHNATNLLAAVACALELGVLPREIERRAATFEGAPHRLRLLPSSFGYILDDAYNANPESMRAALGTLAELDLPVAKRAFIFGEMLELGEEGGRCHTEVLELALRLGIRPIFPIGDEAIGAARRVLNQTPRGTFVFARKDELVGRVPEALGGAASLVLVKGSHSVGLDRVVEDLVARPKDG